MGWADFRDAVDALIRSRGHGFVVEAFHPAPEDGAIDSEYIVPVSIGEPAYRTLHNQLVPVQPAIK